MVGERTYAEEEEVCKNMATNPTMHDEYRDGSDHECCSKCGYCVTCGDCGDYGCGEGWTND